MPDPEPLTDDELDALLDREQIPYGHQWRALLDALEAAERERDMLRRYAKALVRRAGATISFAATHDVDVTLAKVLGLEPAPMPHPDARCKGRNKGGDDATP